MEGGEFGGATPEGGEFGGATTPVPGPSKTGRETFGGWDLGKFHCLLIYSCKLMFNILTDPGLNRPPNFLDGFSRGLAPGIRTLGPTPGQKFSPIQRAKIGI